MFEQAQTVFDRLVQSPREPTPPLLRKILSSLEGCDVQRLAAIALYGRDTYASWEQCLAYAAELRSQEAMVNHVMPEGEFVSACLRQARERAGRDGIDLFANG